MTIVASNNLTISNVNDGTITHYAYANSADGTDGFYIGGGRNLLNNTDKDISVTSHTTDGYPAWANIDTGFSFEHGKTYTFSAEANNSTDKIAEASIRVFENSTNTQVGIYAFPADGKRHSVTFTIPNDSHNYHLLFYAGHAGIAPGVDLTTTYHHYKLEEGDVSAPAWSPAPSEAHPSYIGQYTDFNTTASTDPAKYAPWIIFKGNDGNMGKSVWSYPYNRGANRVGSYWSDLKPTPTTDNPPKVGDTIIDLVGNIYQITNVVVGTSQQGGGIFDYGPILTSVKGADGAPGKVVSDTEPTTRFKGLTWKYSGTSDLTASDGTVIHPNTEYYYNGTHWMINYLSANNIEANSITADLIDAKNLTITDGEFVSTTTNGPVTTSTEIKDNHIAISKTDGTVNTKNDLAVDTDQGFAMKFTNNTTGLTREASVNFQGVSTSDSNGNYAQLTPQGTKLSTDVPWTDITRASGVGTSGTLRARINNGVFYAQSKDVTIPSIAPNSLITIGTMSSKFSGVSGFDALGLLYSLGQLSVASVTVSNSGDINIGNPNPTTMSGKVIQFSINIPLG
ncbi:hypothetical protein ACQUE4_09295 [Lactococcus lactis]|uniref:hypothetical protein n=1 Tax=Lactococcus lactis TaxID=1358 RepID=UPI003D103A61